MENFDFEHRYLLSNTMSFFEQILIEGEENKVSITLSNIPEIMRHAKGGIENVYDLEPKHREEIYNWLNFNIKETQRVIEEKNLNPKERRLELLSIFRNLVNKAFEKPNVTTTHLKLTINAPKKVVYHLIQQLKNINIEGATPFLSQTNRELAEFLINNVEGFENSKVNTVAQEIARRTPKLDSTIEAKKKS